ncbi:MAG: CinA family nicotinamide mononucleotide deamidase-related protein [Planctomycetes bacterium]|nr:CinA family nicotinamide mononucleotide deamidase-related protein [Planctomycetota bacterium]
MRIEVLSTGTELLRGRSVDTNLGAIARELEAVGGEVRYHATCGDDLARLVEELKLAASRADVCIMTGGLGPTEDDLTRAAVEEALHRPLRFRPALWRAIRSRFRRLGVRVAAINRRQAFLPGGAGALANANGSAPGFRLEADGLLLFALPGPPREALPMFRRFVVPELARRLRKDWDLWEGKAIGLPEADVDALVRRIVGKRATYGLTVSGGVVSISVRTGGPSRRKILRDLSMRVRRALGRRFIDAPIEEVVARLLAKRCLTIAVAESCTGGLIAHRLTNVPGISASLLETAVTYSNGSKVRRLSVPEEVLRKRGAVSPEVAAAMAEGMARSSGADVGLATTGIAGPAGGTREKPVGLVYTAVAFRGKTAVTERRFGGGRPDVKDRAATHALNLARIVLQEG